MPLSATICQCLGIYPLQKCRAVEVVHVVRNHAYALVKQGEWKRIENTRRRREEEKARESSLAVLENTLYLRTAEVGESKRQEELLRQMLRQANRLKGEFLANMSHELRTPLNAIIGFSQMMQDERLGPVSRDQKEYLGDILNSAQHLLELINDILALVQMEAGKLVFHPEPVVLQHLIKEACATVCALALKKRIRLGIFIDPNIKLVVIDPDKLKQVVYNYLSNAIKFTPDGGCVTVRVIPEGHEEFRLEVNDSGSGIEPEDIGKLFVEFQQLDSTLGKLYPGIGLGLALTKRIIEAQGGKVGVDSIMGKGSTFFADLPCQSLVLDSK